MTFEHYQAFVLTSKWLFSLLSLLEMITFGILLRNAGYFFDI